DTSLARFQWFEACRAPELLERAAATGADRRRRPRLLRFEQVVRQCRRAACADAAASDSSLAENAPRLARQLGRSPAASRPSTFGQSHCRCATFQLEYQAWLVLRLLAVPGNRFSQTVSQR